MRPSRALKLVREKMKNSDLIGSPEQLIKRTHASGYKKKRGDAKQNLYDRIAAYALSCPMSTLSEIALDNNVSMNTVAAVLKEFGIRKDGEKIGRQRVPWVKIQHVIDEDAWIRQKASEENPV